MTIVELLHARGTIGKKFGYLCIQEILVVTWLYNVSPSTSLSIHTTGKLACLQTSPLPQEKSGEETAVNRRDWSCSGIYLLRLFFCSFTDSWKGTCRSKNSSGVCAQASRTSSRKVHPKIQIQDLWLQSNQVKHTFQDPINIFIIRKLNPW